MTDTQTLNRVARRLHRDDIEIGDARDMPWLELDNEGQDYYRNVSTTLIGALKDADYDLDDATVRLTYLYLKDNPDKVGDTTVILVAVYHSVAMVKAVLKGGK